MVSQYPIRPTVQFNDIGTWEAPILQTDVDIAEDLSSLEVEGKCMCVRVCVPFNVAQLEGTGPGEPVLLKGTGPGTF